MPKVKKRNAAIQTGVDLEAGLIYHWNVENSVTVVGQQYGLGYVDPTPIASHIVSADALEGEISLPAIWLLFLRESPTGGSTVSSQTIKCLSLGGLDSLW